MSQPPRDTPGRWVQTAPGAPPVYHAAAGRNGPAAAGGSADPHERPGVLGAVALGVAIAAVAVSSLLSAITGFLAADGAMAHAISLSPRGLEDIPQDQLLALLSPVRGLVLWAEVGFWLGMALGLWALVQGIIAIATRAGRGAGIAAVILVIAGPFVYGVIVGAAVLGGVAAGAGG